MGILLNVWLAFNIVFGLWTVKNTYIKLSAALTGRKALQSGTGKLIDMFVFVSALSYYFTVY